MSPLLSVRDVATFTGLSEYTVRQAIREGDLPGVKIRSRLRVDPDVLQDWLHSHSMLRAPSVQALRAPAPPPRSNAPAGGYRRRARRQENAA